MTTAVHLVRDFRHQRALVIGDVMLDTYLEGSAARLCSEGPVPVVRKTSELRVPGGAANTAANLRALDAEVILLGIVGRDLAGSMLRAALRKQGIDDSFLVEDEEASTLHKLRILADGQYVVRFDDEEANSYGLRSHRYMLTNLRKVFASCDVVVVSDYCYGVVEDTLLDWLRELRKEHPIPLLVDSKDLYRFREVKATVVTPNHLEARLLVDAKGASGATALKKNNDLQGVERIGQRLLDMLDTEAAAITLAANGVLLVDRQRSLHIPAHPVEHANDVGAGDSFTSAMALALAAGAHTYEAARIGVDAASIAVTKRWTSVVSTQELLQRVSLREYTTRTPEKGIAAAHAGPGSEELELLKLRLEAERQAGRTIVFTNGVFDILHAGHVHFLRKAKELGDMLVVGINSDRSARRLKGKGRPINSAQDRLALVAALDPVDAVILFDEDTPTKLIRELRPQIHVKGGDYANQALPEAEAVEENGGRVVILPLAGGLSTSGVIDRIMALAGTGGER